MKVYLGIQRCTKRGHAIELHLPHQVLSTHGVLDAIALHLAIHEPHRNSVRVKQACHLQAAQAACQHVHPIR